MYLSLPNCNIPSQENVFPKLIKNQLIPLFQYDQVAL